MSEENQLAVVVQKYELEPTKAQVMLDNFSNLFKFAAEYEQIAKNTVVTDASQTDQMQIARIYRLKVRDERLAVEKIRKELKEQSLREGRAIDGISNILKALLVPIEEHFAKQERFIEIKVAEEIARIAEEERLEAERLERERIEAEEKVRRDEEERIRAENEQLRKDKEEAERKAAEEREVAAKKQRALEAAKRKSEQKAKAEREAAEAAAQKAREEQAERDRAAEIERRRVEAENQAKLEDERKKREKTEAARQVAEDQERIARDQARALLDAEVECPNCHHKFVPKSR